MSACQNHSPLTGKTASGILTGTICQYFFCISIIQCRFKTGSLTCDHTVLTACGRQNHFALFQFSRVRLSDAFIVIIDRCSHFYRCINFGFCHTDKAVSCSHKQKSCNDNKNQSKSECFDSGKSVSSFHSHCERRVPICMILLLLQAVCISSPTAE